MVSLRDISIEIGETQKTVDFTTHPGVIKRQKQIDQRRQRIENIYQRFQSYYRNIRTFDYRKFCIDNIIETYEDFLFNNISNFFSFFLFKKY